MGSPRVLLLSNAITPDRAGGVERYVRELGGALSRRGADVMILARRVDPEHPAVEIDADGVEIRRFETPSKTNPLYAAAYPAATFRAVARTVSEQAGTRVVHSHFPLQGLPMALGRRPFVHTFHAPVFRELAPERQGAYALPGLAERAAIGLMRRAESRIVRRAAEVVTLSEFMRDEALALGAPSVRVVPGGLDSERFAPGEPVADPWARGEGPLLFTARRMVSRTGVGELVEAFVTIAQRVPGARLAIAGKGPLEEEIRDRIAALGLGERARLVGWITDEELVGWYRAADLVVMPTQELEGFGLTSAEALACGTPVIATPVGANPEVVRLLDGGLTTRDASPDAIADVAVELLLDPARLAALAERARAAVVPALSWDGVAETYLEIYRRHQPVSASGARGAKTQPSQELVALLRSPSSGDPLSLNGETLNTPDGGETFPAPAGIPVLFAADSAFSAEDYIDVEIAPASTSRRLRGEVRRALPSLSHNLSAPANFIRFGELLREGATEPLVLVVGGAIVGEGMRSLIDDPTIRLVEADVAVGPRTDVICDAHSLPFADRIFDGVVCQAVLEHVADPPRVVGEIHRVLRLGGLVYSEIPFMQQVHEGAYDFTRYTYNGHRRLFRGFDEIDAGATAGPGMVLGWSIRSLLSSFAGESRTARGAVNLFTTFAFFWLKYLDRPLMRGEAILDGASGTWFLGRSREMPRSDSEIIAGFRGVNSGFSARR